MRLNRPEALNAINGAIRDTLPRAIAEVASDQSVRSVVLIGAGNRAFCAGADIKEFESPSSLVDARALRQSSPWNDALEQCAKPVVAAIRGYCLGGGLEMALACDVRIAADDAIFGMPEVGLGLIPGAGGTQRLPRIVGRERALRMMLSGERATAGSALTMGLVSEVVPAADLLKSALETARRLGDGAPWAISYVKECVRRGLDLPLNEGLRLEADLSTVLLTTHDRSEGVRAFRERRRPEFRGM